MSAWTWRWSSQAHHHTYHSWGYAVVLKCPKPLMSVSQKRWGWRDEGVCVWGGRGRGRKGHRSFKSTGGHFTCVGRGLKQWGEKQQKLQPPIFVWASVRRRLNQRAEGSIDDQSRSQIFGEQDPFCLLQLLQAVCKLLEEHVHSCLPRGWKRCMGSCYCAKSWNWLILTAIYHLIFLLEIASLEQNPEFQNKVDPCAVKILFKIWVPLKCNYSHLIICRELASRWPASPTAGTEVHRSSPKMARIDALTLCLHLIIVR